MKIISTLIFFLNIIYSYSYNYLNNYKVDYNVMQMDLDHPWDQGKPTSGYHIGYPRGGIGCITSKDDDDNIYLISSQALLSRWNEYYRCRDQYRTVSIFKRNLTTSVNTNELIIGEEYKGSDNYQCYYWNDYDETKFSHLTGTERYNKEIEVCTSKGHFWRNNMNPIPTECHCGCCQKIKRPVGGKGSDHVVTCGIDKESNILYYIGANYHKCGDYYNTNPSLVRINLTSFEFIDRTILNKIEDNNNLTKWHDEELETKSQYFNFPGTSEIYNGNVFLSFRIPNNGIWVINIRSDKVKIETAYQVFEPYEHIELNGTEEVKIIRYYPISSVGSSYFNKADKLIYFVSENFKDNAKIVILNLTDLNFLNKTSIVELNGINNVKKIKMDNIKNNIYLLVGQVSSKLYKMDKSFTIIPVSESCSINSLEFPTEWKNAENLEIDDIGGFIYIFFIMKPYNGFVTVRINDFSLNHTFNKFIFYNKDNDLWEPEYLNVSYINRKSGKIFISNFPNENNFFMSISEISMFGCSMGRRSNFNECKLCLPGTFSNIIGSNFCKLCDYGHASSKHESNNCESCQKGKYSNILGSSTCISCSSGNYSELSGSKNCKTCQSGKYNIKIGSFTPSDCLKCEFGKYSLPGSEYCSVCDLGKVTHEMKNCLNCPEGTYSNNLGIVKFDECKKCPKGKYNNKTGSNSIDDCIDCPEGKYSLILGGIEKSSCLYCPPGKYRNLNINPGDGCSVCQNGKYSKKGYSNCKLCEKGKYNNGDNDIDHIKCIPCGRGKYNEIDGGNSEQKCLNCPLGKYSFILGSNTSNTCIDCEKGKFNDILGAKSIEYCKNCPKGKYRKFKSGTSINDCIDCSVGYFSNEDVSECNRCKLGKYGLTPGLSFCESCDEGKYADNNGTILCKDCPINSQSSNHYTNCECISGTYMTSLNPLVCDICPENFICDKGSTIETLKLKRKFWRANISTLHIEECKKGYNCIGGIIKNSSDDLCNKGHTGPICDVCFKGWAKNDGKCYKCLTDTNVKVRSYIFTILFPIIISFITFFMIKTANPSSSSAQKEPLSGVIKIFMNYAQIFTLASSFEINWPEIILILFDRTKEFSSPKISFYSSDCTIGWNYYNKLLIYIILPIIYVIIVTLILSIYTFLFYKNKRDVNIKNKNWGTKSKNEYHKFHPEPLIFYKSWLCTSTLIGLFLSLKK